MAPEILFDEHQKKAIVSLANTVVTAGAGSGKTAVLTERFFWLLSTRDIGIDRICALTFTKKAAREMHERIYQRLLKNVADPKVQNHLANFQNASIQTIDSFSSGIVKNAATRFGLPQDFSYDEENLAGLASRLGLELLFSHGYKPGVQSFLSKFGFSRFIDEIIPEFCSRVLTLSQDIDFPALFERQVSAMREILQNLSVKFAEVVGMMEKSWPEKKGDTPGSPSPTEAWTRLAGFLASENLAEAMGLMKTISLRKPCGKTTEANAGAKELVDLVRSLKAEVENALTVILNQEEMRDLFAFFADLQIRFHDEKRSRGIVSYRDVALLAVEALKRDHALRAWYKKKYRYIMIDEFQDNNIVQKELLYLLAERDDRSSDGIPEAADLQPDKLFFVGDEKQSIYAFRGADVSVFKKLKRDFNASGEGIKSLPVNYRSHPGLIGFFNKVFESVMAGASEEHEAEFEPLQSAPKDPGYKPGIFIFLGDKEKDADSETDDDDGAAGDSTHDEQEAWALACFIRDSIARKTLMVERDGETVPATYRDFAVLMRSTGNQIILERMFRYAGIPYSTQGIRSLFLEAIVNDFYALFQCALFPDDRFAYAALLRGPLVNVSDTAFFFIMESRQPPFTPIELENEDDVKYGSGRTLYEHVRSRADRVPITALVADVWYRFGYRYSILRHPGHHTFLEYYDYLFELARKADKLAITLAEFARRIRKHLGDYEKMEDLDIIQDDSDSVMIMSIHRAKGLEFPVVCIPNMGNIGKTEHRNPPLAVTPEFPLCLAVRGINFLYQKHRDLYASRSLAELKRLLYVGLTRAKSHLILSGIRSRRNRKRDSCMLSLLTDALGFSENDVPKPESGEYLLEVRKIEPFDRRDLAQCAERIKMNISGARRFYESAAAPKRPAYAVDISVSRISREYAAVQLESAGRRELPGLATDRLLETDEDHKRWGILVHFLLHQRLCGTFGSESTVPELCASLPIHIRTSWPDKTLQALVGSAMECVERFYASRWGSILAGAEALKSEYAFLLLQESHGRRFFIDGVIDLLIMHQDRVYVIDFKTDRVLDPVEYQAQLSFYAEAAGEMTGKKPEAFLFLLRNGESVPVVTSIDREALFTRLSMV